MMKRKLALLAASAVLGLGLAGVAQAQSAVNDTAALVHVGLNPSTCGSIPGANSGVANVHFNVVQERFKANISVHDALPDTTYVIDIRCVGAIGTLTTNAQGTGTAQITLSFDTAPSGPFYIDISVPPPGGGGAGDYGDTFIAGPLNLQ